MEPALPVVISASRRTDIPAFYMQWFMAGIAKGAFEVINPYNRRVSVVPAGPDRVHTIVFWSKNFGPFIAGDYGRRLEDAGYHLFFNFTVNSREPLLEPHVPPLNERFHQLRTLCRCHDPRAVTWRFDPVCFYRTGDGTIKNNLMDFDRIARAAADCGIVRCTTSFMDDYRKIRRRTAAMPGFSFIDPPMNQKLDLVMDMQRRLAQHHIALATCCEAEVQRRLPPDSPIAPAACIPSGLLKTLYGGRLSMRRDAGQRIRQGCGCRVSVDIGSYHLHPCYHNCLFCYANPSALKDMQHRAATGRIDR